MSWSTVALDDDETGWLRNKSMATRLGFAVQLKFLPWRGPVAEDAAGAAGQISDLTAVPLGLPGGEVVQRQLERGHADLAGDMLDRVARSSMRSGTTNGARSGSVPNSSRTCGPRARWSRRLVAW